MNFKDLEELYRINQWLGMDIAVIWHDILLCRVHKQFHSRCHISIHAYNEYVDYGGIFQQTISGYTDFIRYLKGRPSNRNIHCDIWVYDHFKSMRERLTKSVSIPKIETIYHSIEYLHWLTKFADITNQNGVISLIADFNMMKSLGKLGDDDSGYLHNKVVESKRVLYTYLKPSSNFKLSDEF